MAGDIRIRKERENTNSYAQYRDSTPKFSTRYVTKFQFQMDRLIRKRPTIPTEGKRDAEGRNPKSSGMLVTLLPLVLL